MCWGWAKQWFANRRAVEEEVRCNSKLLSLGCHSGSGTTVQAQPWRWHDNVGSYWPCTAPRFRRSSLYHFLIFFINCVMQCDVSWEAMRRGFKPRAETRVRWLCDYRRVLQNAGIVSWWLQRECLCSADMCLIWAYILVLLFKAEVRGKEARRLQAEARKFMFTYLFRMRKKAPYLGTISIYFHPISFIPLFIPFFSFSSIPCLKFWWDVFMLWWFSWTLALQELLVGLKGFQDCGSIAPRRCRPSTRLRLIGPTSDPPSRWPWRWRRAEWKGRIS